jgi:hypothetical protein
LEKNSVGSVVCEEKGVKPRPAGNGLLELISLHLDFKNPFMVPAGDANMLKLTFDEPPYFHETSAAKGVIKMRKFYLFLPAMILALIYCFSSRPQKAEALPLSFDVRFCGANFYFETSDYPTHVIWDIIVTEQGTGSTYGWVLNTRNAEWIDAGVAIGSLQVVWGTPTSWVGDFFVMSDDCPASATPTPEPPRTALIDMYVYFSETPFFGETNTLTIYSALGAPSKGTVTALAGGKLPEGFAYGAPVCWAPLYDDGTDKGSFACDSFLASAGERRAWLRNDPEGPKFDLLPKIEQYYKMLDDLDLTPRAP